MSSFLGLENISAPIQSSPASPSRPTPRLLLELEPWGRTFRRNLLDSLLLRRPAAVATTTIPADFWPDVFVPSRLPWGAFLESIVYHCIVFGVAWGFSTIFATRPQITPRPVFHASDVLYYSPSEYLPPIDTGSSQRAKPQKGEPEFARQPILSVPPESDNHHQTIVTPPNVKLTQDVQTPNIVAWGDRSVPVPIAATERNPASLPALPNQIVAPAPELNQSRKRNLSSLTQPVVAPPPNVESGNVHAVASLSIDVVAPAPDASVAGSRRLLNAPQGSVVEPPPAINAAEVRKLGDINIGHSEVVAPAPQLPVSPQRAVPTIPGNGKAIVPPPPSLDAGAGNGASAARHAAHGQGSLGRTGTEVVPPPPATQGAASSAGAGRMIALGIHPSVAPPAEPPQGNRRGTFAASPEGKGGAAGTPEIKGDSTDTDGRGLARGSASGIGAGSSNNGAPPGIHVGAPAQPPTSNTTGGGPLGSSAGSVGDPKGTMMASASASPKIGASPGSASASAHGPKVDVIDNPSPLEQQIFHGRRLYSMTLNMPNLNSAGGSWVIRFAELNSNAGSGELVAPVAEHKVDPAYPLQLMSENVSGTVTLRAIIRTDGTVGDIHVVNGADQRLDHYASEALARWHFRPAIKNGSTIDVEAIVMIPFKPILRRPF
jgi:TonB family protein